MTEEDLASLVEGFETCTLPAEHWTHAAHMLVALHYVRALGAEAALGRMRAGIQRYNDRVIGKPGAYHETITHAWIRLIAALHAELHGASLAALTGALLSRYGQSGALGRHYSAALLGSAEARARFVEPDLAPLP